MTLLSVPVINVAPFRHGTREERRTIGKLVDQACRDIGFLVISGHGIPASLLADVQRCSREFFDLPLAQKMEVARPEPDVARGYVEIEGESVGRSRDSNAYSGDLNESFMIGPVEIHDASYAMAEEAGKHFAPKGVFI